MELRGEPKFALQNFEVGGSILVEKMHTPETKMYYFSKIFAYGGILSFSYDFHLEQADIALLGMRILVKKWIKGGDRTFSD